MKLKEEETLQLIRTLSPDLILVNSFNQIIPKAIITIPRIGVVNFHPSLLPKYRGATPTVWALVNGEKETGVTAHFIEDEKIDCGRIITQEKIKIEPLDNDGTLRRKIATLSEKVLIDTLSLIIKQSKEAFPLQDESEATYYRKRTLEDSEINPDNSFMDNLNRIKAMSPYPGANLTYNGKRYIVSNATLSNSKSQVDTLENDDNKLAVKTPDGIVLYSINKRLD
jgi:methionyl-tRNA formyltransferase